MRDNEIDEAAAAHVGEALSADGLRCLDIRDNPIDDGVGGEALSKACARPRRRGREPRFAAGGAATRRRGISTRRGRGVAATPPRNIHRPRRRSRAERGPRPQARGAAGSSR